MKLLVVGGDYIWSIERFYIKYLKENDNAQVEFFPAQNYLYDYLNTGVFNKIKHRLRSTQIYAKINNLLTEKINKIQPDIIWVFKGMEVWPETLKFARDKGIKLVNYNPDNPFIFSGRGSGNLNVTRSINLYDLYMTYSSDIKEQLIQEAKVDSKLLPFAFEIPAHITYNKLAATEEITKVCFIGNPDNDRAKIILSLLNSGIEIELFGNNWDKFISHSGAVIYNPVYGDDQWYALRQYRVQLNMLRKHNLTSHNMRSFEIPGVGGIQLAPYTKEHAVFFEPEVNIFLYKNLDEAVEKINKLLKMSKSEADKIRYSAYSSCIDSGYTYKARADEVFKIFNELIQ